MDRSEHMDYIRRARKWLWGYMRNTKISYGQAETRGDTATMQNLQIRQDMLEVLIDMLDYMEKETDNG